jgi:hypothetical protein
MSYSYLSLIASSLVIVGYIPEVIYIVRNKIAKPSNLPIWLIWIVSSIFGAVYCYLINEYFVMINFLINLFFCTICFGLNIYYVCINNNDFIEIVESVKENKKDVIL